MPYGDGNGPVGEGPLTGRRLGFCAENQQPGFRKTPIYGRGLAHRRGLGRGNGRGHRNFPSVVSNSPDISPYKSTEENKEERVQYLKKRTRVLEDELKCLKDEVLSLDEKENDND